MNEVAAAARQQFIDNHDDLALPGTYSTRKRLPIKPASDKYIIWALGLDHMACRSSVACETMRLQGRCLRFARVIAAQGIAKPANNISRDAAMANEAGPPCQEEARPPLYAQGRAHLSLLDGNAANDALLWRPWLDPVATNPISPLRIIEGTEWSCILPM